MKASDLNPRIIAVYAGRFHPFHIGHSQVFQALAKKFGSGNTFITTSGKVDPEKSPFSFDEKKIMMVAAGIPAAHIIEETAPYSPSNLIEHLGLDPNKDSLVFGVGKKDMAEDPRFNFKPLKDGTVSYFQPYTENKLKPFNSEKKGDGSRVGHGYIYPVPDIIFSIDGVKMKSASEIRKMYKETDKKLGMLKELYPTANQKDILKIKKIFDNKLG